MSAQGITIITLVITIIIMLILAAVVLNLTIGEHGIFKTAKMAAKNYTNAQEKEIKEIDEFTNTFFGIVEENTDTDIGNGTNDILENQYETLLQEINSLKSKIQTLENNTTTLDKIYPIGSIYISSDLSTKEAVSEKIGGTWESYAEGRTLIGVGTGTDINSISQTFVNDTTGGEYTHTLSIAEMPRHNHQLRVRIPVNFSEEQFTTGPYLGLPGIMAHAWTEATVGTWESEGDTDGGGTGTLEIGGSQSHNNIQPYITVYMWKRIK